jgi:hypothetical protein
MVSSVTSSGKLDDHGESFNCPHCDALYIVVRVRNESGDEHGPIHCRACRGAIPPTDGDDLLKYFLVRKPPNWRK